MRAQQWLHDRPDLPGEHFVANMRRSDLEGSRTERELFRIGVAATCSLTMAVFLWAVVKLPVRDAVSSVELPGLKPPAIAATVVQTALPAAPPAPPSSPPATAVPTLAPAAVPTAAPTAVPPKAARPAPSPSAPVEHAGGTYAVQPGDTLFSIARRHGVTVQSIASLNNLSDSGLVKVGEQLKVP